jgi:streptomycin 6-kinase
VTSDRDRLDAVAQAWRVVIDGSLRASPTALVAFGGIDGRPVVVKLARGDDEHRAAAALRHYAGHGAVRLLAATDGALLLERAVPGQPLTARVHACDDDATLILCDVIAALHRQEPPKVGFPGVAAWGSAHEAEPPADRRLPKAMVARARGLQRDLVSSAAGERLLHGDLHHDNVVLDAARGWLAIDPKGVIGESAYEVGAALRNPAGDPRWFAVPAILDRRARLFSERLGLDLERIFAWGYAQAVLAALWAIEDGDDPAAGLATAEAIDALR